MYEPYNIAHTGRCPPPGASKRKTKGMNKDFELVTLSCGGDNSTQMRVTVNLDESPRKPGLLGAKATWSKKPRRYLKDSDNEHKEYTHLR